MKLHPHKLIQTIETLSFRALPALEQRDYDGWIMRYANGRGSWGLEVCNREFKSNLGLGHMQGWNPTSSITFVQWVA